MLSKMQCFALQSMGHTNHILFPVHTTWNVQTQQKSTVQNLPILLLAYFSAGKHISFNTVQYWAYVLLIQVPL